MAYSHVPAAHKNSRLPLVVLLLACLACALAAFGATQAAWAEDGAEAQAPEAQAADVGAIVANMTLDEKISQMIIPALRSWNEANVTDLGAVPELASGLRAHQYGGVILFGQNVTGTEQTARLVSALQSNNAQVPASTHIPYFTPVDEEGGIVLRLSMGTRMTGSMAVGATGAAAVDNARATGQVLGEECAVLGFNVDYAPTIDVNNNPGNPVIGTRSFSDDPERVGPLGLAYGQGLAASNIIATYKHFPGHGDTSVDSHIGTPSVEKTYDQLKATELVPFQAAIDAGADMIMTAHITYPLVDDEVVFGDGTTKGYYPATMSKKMITDILRNDMGYNGVVVTDALEMDAIHKAKLVPGEEGSVEYRANVAEKVINAGVDILLIPTDMNNPEAVQFYDEYIAALIEKVQGGEIPLQRIDESVTRILELKKKYGILDIDTSGANIDEVVAKALQTVGSAAHHDTEAAIAEQAITLVKNEGLTLPLNGHGTKTVILGRETDDQTVISYAIAQLQEAGVVDKDAYINNLCAGTTSGSPDAATSVTIGHYYNLGAGEVEYGDAEKAAIAQADNVVCFSKMFGLAAMQPTGAIYQAISQVIADAHAAGAKFVLLSGNLPYDAARYADADAIVLAYMSSGINIDPTDRNADTGSASAYNANLGAGIEAMFDNKAPTGTLPVNIPAMVAGEDGAVSYSSDVLYARGLGLNYAYQFTAGMEGTHEGGSTEALDFVTNARNDKLVRIVVDGTQVDAAAYTSTWGQTRLQLSADFLNALAAGEHVLQAVYDYDGAEVVAQTTFTTTAVPEPKPTSSEPASSEPISSEPASSEPASSDPTSSEPAASSQQQPTKPAGNSGSSAGNSTTPTTPAKQAATTTKQTTAKTADETPLAVLASVLLLSMTGAVLAQRRTRD